MNKVVLLGNLTRDPELRSTTNGTSVCQFIVACQRRFANAQGVREADFINCVAWKNTGEMVAKCFSKGNKIAVSGSLQTRTYEAQDGSKRYVTEVVADQIEFVERKQTQGSQTPTSQYANVGATDENGFTEVQEDELPF